MSAARPERDTAGPDLAAPEPDPGATAGHPGLRPAVNPLHLVPFVLALIAEGAWISILAGLVQEYSLHDPFLGVPALVAFVAAGAIAARLLAERAGSHWPLVAVGLTIAGVAVGWLLAPEARAELAAGEVGRALATHPGGMLAGLAVLRGFAYLHLPPNESTLTHLFVAGIPGIALAAIAGGMISEPWRARFLADSLPAAITFVTSVTLGLAFARLTALGADSGFDWRRNPVWVSLLVILVLVTGGIAIPASIIAAPAVSLLLGIAVGPLVLIGLMLGFQGRTVRVLGISAAVGIAVYGLLLLFGGRTQQGEAGGGAAPTAPAAPDATGETVALLAAILVPIAVIVIVVLARLWMRRSNQPPDDVAETRTIDRGSPMRRSRSPRRRARAPRRREPVDAVGAYVRLLDELAARPDVARAAAETPAEHARRLRAIGYGGLSLELLAADYALARFGGVGLSEREDRRALARWRVLRRRLAGSRG
jgi:hypothetical protein